MVFRTMIGYEKQIIIKNVNLKVVMSNPIMKICKLANITQE